MDDAYKTSSWAWGGISLAWGMRPYIWPSLALSYSGEASLCHVCHLSTSLPEHEEVSLHCLHRGGGQLGGWVGSTG